MEDTVSDLLDADLLDRLSHLGVPTRAVVSGTLSGVHRNPQHGSSVEFAEHQEYAPGDEVRRIDWRVFGRTDKYYVRCYEDETNLQAYFVLDSSGSMAYGQGEQNKLRYAARLAANLAYLLLHQQDAVGLVTVGATVERHLPARARSIHLRELCAQLCLMKPAGSTGLTAGLTHVGEVAEKYSTIYVVSDLFAQESQMYRALRRLRAQHHTVVLFQILHPDELHFPFRRLTAFQSLEGHQRVILEARAIRTAYLQSLQAFLERIRLEAGNVGITHVQVETSQPLEHILRTHIIGRCGPSRSTRRAV